MLSNISAIMPNSKGRSNIILYTAKCLNALGFIVNSKVKFVYFSFFKLA